MWFDWVSVEPQQIVKLPFHYTKMTEISFQSSLGDLVHVDCHSFFFQTLVLTVPLLSLSQITNHPSLQRLWSRPRSRSPLLGKADQESSHRRGQTSLLLPRQSSSKSSIYASVQPVCRSVLNHSKHARDSILSMKWHFIERARKCLLYIVDSNDCSNNKMKRPHRRSMIFPFYLQAQWRGAFHTTKVRVRAIITHQTQDTVCRLGGEDLGYGYVQYGPPWALNSRVLRSTNKICWFILEQQTTFRME